MLLKESAAVLGAECFHIPQWLLLLRSRKGAIMKVLRVGGQVGQNTDQGSSSASDCPWRRVKENGLNCNFSSEHEYTLDSRSFFLGGGGGALWIVMASFVLFSVVVMCLAPNYGLDMLDLNVSLSFWWSYHQKEGPKVEYRPAFNQRWSRNRCCFLWWGFLF